MTVTNGADLTKIHRLRGVDPNGRLTPTRELLPGKTARTERRSGWSPPEPNMSKADFERWCRERTTITFKINGRHWRRARFDEVELIEEDDALD
jgi:hypothetical protein